MGTLSREATLSIAVLPFSQQGSTLKGKTLGKNSLPWEHIQSFKSRSEDQILAFKIIFIHKMATSCRKQEEAMRVVRLS